MQIVRVKLCFLVDCTGSMEPWIQAAKDQMKAILEKTQSDHSDADLRFQVAFVGYRDYGDEHQFEVVPFTSPDRLLATIALVHASGGDDLAEDVAGGLERVLQLPWHDSDVRTLIHIADAPPHGLDFHAPRVSDRFPDGDPQGIDVKLLLRQLAHDVDMTFLGLNTSTDRYVEAVLDAYREVQKRAFTVADLRPQDTHFLTPLASQAVRESIGRYSASQDPTVA
jgi:hypothetical protein